MARGADFTEFDAFVAKFQEFVANGETQAFIDRFLVEMGERVIADAVNNTPVDTGALRSAWQLGEIKRAGKESEIEILNGMEYASHVEYGHAQTPGRYVPAIGKRLVADWVEGHFMLTKAEDRAYDQMEARFNKAFGEFVKSKGLE